MKVSDFALGAGAIVLGVVLILHARTFPQMAGMAYGPSFFPVLIGSGVVICGLGMALGALIGGNAFSEPAFKRPDWSRQRLPTLRAAAVVASVAVFALAAPILGFLLTVFLIAVGLLLLMGVRWPIALPLSVATPILLHYGFAVALRVPLPRGILEKAFF